MRTALLACVLVAAFSTSATSDGLFPQADMPTVLSAIEGKDGAVLVKSLYGREFSLTPAQTVDVDKIVRSHLAELAESDAAARDRAVAVIVAINLDRMGIDGKDSERLLSMLVQRDGNTPQDTVLGTPAPDIVQENVQFPEVLADALSANDAPAAISYLLANKIDGEALGERRQDLIDLVLGYVST